MYKISVPLSEIYIRHWCFDASDTFNTLDLDILQHTYDPDSVHDPDTSELRKFCRKVFRRHSHLFIVYLT